GAAHSARERERRQRLGALEKPDRFVDCGGAFFRPNPCMAWEHQDVAVHAGSQFLDVGRVERGVLPGEIELANDGATGNAVVVFFSREERKSGQNYERKSEGN